MKLMIKPFVYAFTGIMIAIASLTSSAGERPGLTPQQWKDDLIYFKNLVHTKYSNLFYNVSQQQFNDAVAAVEKKIGTLSDLQMNMEFVKLVAMFRVGHTAVRQRMGTGNDLVPWVNPAPIKFYPFSDGIYIKRIDNRFKEALGGKVLRIGNFDVDVALEKLKPAMAFENEQGYANMIQHNLNLPEFLFAMGIIDDLKEIPVMYRKDGKERTIMIPAQSMAPGNAHGNFRMPADWSDVYEGYNTPGSVLWLKNPDRLRHMEWLASSKTLYVRHSAVQDEQNETIADFFTRVFRFIDSADVEKFVLDIRLNGGGNNYLNKPVITGIIAARKINRKGHFFIITGKETFSAAQNLTNELEKYTEAIFVGEPTSENVNFYGDTRVEILPNSKLNIALSWLWWQNLDPRDKRKWTAPELAADMRFEDYQKGVDPSMNAIMNYKPTASIDDKLRALFMQGKLEEAITTAREYIKDPLHRYYAGDLENKINDLGYNMMNQNNFEQANKLFYMNVQLFPGSANAYDSYAESFWKLGKKEEAIKYYEMAISKDPNGDTGANAKKMIEQIK